MTTMEDVEPVVIRWLSDADTETLTRVCAGIPLTIPQEKAGKKTLILKLLLKHLHSDAVEASEDEGLAIFLKIHAELEGTLGDKKETMKSEPREDRSENSMEKIAVHRLREFKINGTIGEVDQKDTLSYTSLSFQMKRGKEAGYGSNEIRTAVIKAIKPGSNLRNYLESKTD